MPIDHIGEIIRGSLDLLVGALLSKDISRELPEISFGDFLQIKTRNYQIVGVAGFLQFETSGQIQPLGLPPAQRNEILPDLEDVLYANTLKVVSIPVLGYISKGRIYQEIPPQLPDIHDPIMIMGKKTIEEFHQSKSGINLSYLTRLCHSEVQHQTELIGRIYQRIHRDLKIDISRFLNQLQTSYEEATGSSMPAFFAAKLQNVIRNER